jgi:shikimate O-hydroxycinnamoyltransferase
MPRKALWLSPLDRLMATRGYTPFVQVYRRPSGGDATGFFDVTRLKAALGKALVAFYPFAGRLEVGQDGRFQIDCKGQGALFVVAHNSRLAVDDFGNLKPSPELRTLLVPRVDDSAGTLCAIQVCILSLNKIK